MPTVHEKMGAVPTAEDQQKLDDIALGLVVPGISKAHTMDTKKERALQVLKEFPQHYWHTLYACTVPLVFASVPVIMRGYECRGWSSEVDPAVVANFASMFKYSSPDLSIGTFMLSNINAGLSMATLWTFVCVAACSWWDSKPLLKPMLKIIIPFCCVIGGLSIANRVMTYTGCPLFQGAISTMVPATLSLTCAALVSYILGNHCKMPGFGYMFTLYFALITCVTVIYELILFPLVLESDNMMKLLIASIINPFIFEIFLVFARALVRVMPHVHESTRPILVGSMIAFKKAFQRFVIAMITDSTYVLGASVLLSASEIGYAVSVKVRDRFMYNKLCSACSAPGEDRLAAMKLNKFLRSRNAHYEAVMEYSLTILTGIVLTFAYDVSFDGRKPYYRMGSIMLDLVIQLFFEVVVDLVVVMTLTVYDKQPVMAVAHITYKGAFMTFTVQVMQAVYLVTSFVMYPLLGRQQAGIHESTWIFYTKENFPDHTLTNFNDGNFTTCS